MLKLFLRKYSARDLNMFLINKPIDDPENIRRHFVHVNEYTPANVTQRIICATDMSAIAFECKSLQRRNIHAESRITFNRTAISTPNNIL
jgi:hypothetical protein